MLQRCWTQNPTMQPLLLWVTHQPLRAPPPPHPRAPQINYAESTVECRRALIMHHFGERSFTTDTCKGTCDVCAARGAAEVGASPVPGGPPACPITLGARGQASAAGAGAWPAAKP